MNPPERPSAGSHHIRHGFADIDIRPQKFTGETVIPFAGDKVIAEFCKGASHGSILCWMDILSLQVQGLQPVMCFCTLSEEL